MWTNQSPEAPIGLISEFYWYFDIIQNKQWIVELWPKRYVKHHKGLWWSEPIKHPPPIDNADLPSNPTVTICEEADKLKKKRGRPAKTK